jgi:hypothetical protein
MARPRIPRGKAIITGAIRRNPARFRNRHEPAASGPLGPAPDWMAEPARQAWDGFAVEAPWLNGSHRALVEIAATIRGRMAAREDVGIQALNLLRQCLGQMGATPADASRVPMPEDDQPDPADKYF